MRPCFPAAPWPTSLKVIAALRTVLLLALGYAAYCAILTGTDFAHRLGAGVAVAGILVLLVSLLSIVKGYTVENGDLRVERLVASTRIPLAGLSRVWFEPMAGKDSVRIFGNGGLFSFNGLFCSKRLGRYRAFATNFAHAVVLVLPRGVVMVTPRNPHAFIEHVCNDFPSVDVSAFERDT
jgi:hypothetical protein